MQIAVEEGEKGKFGDGTGLACISIEDSGGGPEPVAGVNGCGGAAQHFEAAIQGAYGRPHHRYRFFQRRIACPVPGIGDHAYFAQVAQQNGQGGSNQPGSDGLFVESSHDPILTPALSL